MLPTIKREWLGLTTYTSDTNWLSTMKKDVVIKIDDQCLMRVLSKDDVSEDYVAWLNDEEVVKYTYQKNVTHNLKSAEAYVVEKLESENELLFGIFYNHEHIGNLVLGPISWEHKSAGVSYLIGNKNFWGKGLASKAVKAAVDYAIDELAVEKINAGYFEVNIGSARVLEKCGFVVEGKRVKDILFEGKRIDMILVGYLAKNKDS